MLAQIVLSSLINMESISLQNIPSYLIFLKYLPYQIPGTVLGALAHQWDPCPCGAYTVAGEADG